MHDKHIDLLSLPPSQVNAMPKRLKIHENKEQGKTKHEAPRSISHKATQNKNNTEITALAQSVA